MSRPSTSCFRSHRRKDVDARHKAGHDEIIDSARAITSPVPGKQSLARKSCGDLSANLRGGLLLSQADADYLKAHFSKSRLLSHWNVGGLLIFRTEGKVPVFVDGCAATAYPDDLLRDYFGLVAWEIDEAAWDNVIAKYRIDAVLWVKAHRQLRHFLVEKRGWKEQYAGDYESVYVKP